MSFEIVEGLSQEDINNVYNEIIENDNVIATCWCNTRHLYSSSRCYDMTSYTSYVCSMGTHYSKSECYYRCSSYCRSVLYVNYQEMSQEPRPLYCRT